jgi:hypothetical protein
MTSAHVSCERGAVRGREYSEEGTLSGRVDSRRALQLARTSVCCSGDNVHGGAAPRRIDSKLFWEEGEAHLDVGEPKVLEEG